MTSASADYGWPASCVGCGSDRTAYESAPRDAFQSAWMPPVDMSPQYAVLEAEADIEAEVDAAPVGVEEALQQVERYAYYPVSNEAAQAHRNALSTIVEVARPHVSGAEPMEPQQAILPREIGTITPY